MRKYHALIFPSPRTIGLEYFTILELKDRQATSILSSADLAVRDALVVFSKSIDLIGTAELLLRPLSSFA